MFPVPGALLPLPPECLDTGTRPRPLHWGTYTAPSSIGIQQLVPDNIAMAGKRDRAAAEAGTVATGTGASGSASAVTDPTLLKEAKFFDKQSGGGGRKADDSPWRLEWVPKGHGDPHYWWLNESTGVWKKGDGKRTQGRGESLLRGLRA